MPILPRKRAWRAWRSGQTNPEGQGFAAIIDQLKGKTFLSGYQKLKGTGNVSEIEGLKTEQAQAG